MNEELKKALKAQVEARQALNALPDDAAEEDRAAKVKALEDADKAVLKALETEPEPAPRQLAQRVELRNYIAPFIEGRQITGAEAELNQGLGLDTDSQVPFEALDPGESEERQAEHRADAEPPALTGINYTTAAVLRRVFARTDSAFLGVMMPSVPAGTAVYPVMTSGGTAGMMAANQARDAGAYALSTVNLNPKRATARYLLNLENQAEIGAELEGVLREDLREQLGQLVDDQVIAGDGQGNNLSGILAGLDDPAADGDLITAAILRNLVIDAVDNRWVPDEGSVRFLMGIPAYKLGRKVFHGTDAVIDGIEAMRNLGAMVRSSTRIPQKSAKVQYGIRTARPDGFVAPVWQGVTLIRDPYTAAAAGQVALTAHMLFSAGFKRKDGWAQVPLKIAA